MKTIGFIGMGNMAQSLAQGMLRADAKLKICAFAPHQDKLKKNAERIGFAAMETPKEVASASDMIVIACKPAQVKSVIEQIAGEIGGKAVLSVAAGWDYARYEEILPEGVRFQYIMPNTPAMIGEGVFLFEDKNSLTGKEQAFCRKIFSAMGMLGAALTGCGPAFVDMMLEAYADGAVKHGMPRERAFRLLSQMVAGAALLQLKTGEHPESLKDKVCSPGGTTIRGCAALEEAGFRNACIRSIDAVLKKD